MFIHSRLYPKTLHTSLLNVISQSWSQPGLTQLQEMMWDDTHTHTLKQQHTSVSSPTGVLPQSEYWFSLRSDPQSVDCRCGQRQPGRPDWCWETHTSLHTHQALKETLSTVWKRENRQEDKGYLWLAHDISGYQIRKMDVISKQRLIVVGSTKI